MRVFKKFKYILYLVLFWFFIHTIFIVIDGLSDERKKADYAVILGSKVNPDGTLSERLEKRMQCGLKLYQEKRVKKIIVSGGLGKEGFYEAEKMFDYLLENQIPKQDIIIDNYGNTTRATVKNSLQFKNVKESRLIVVSQYFHISRTKMLFRKSGVKMFQV
jgi:vancomycin permeability regulator SanA